MNPHIENLNNKNDVLSFTLHGINVSIANSIRRTILSDIPTVVFKTSPYEESKANILVNTSRLNNEILKQRLSCIPIHIPDHKNVNLKNYLLEVKMENTSDTTMYVTTEHFKVKNLVTDSFLSEKDTRNIFPPNDYTGYFIDFVRLRPKLSDDLYGEKIHLTCEFSIGTAKMDGMFNVVSTCSYGMTPDEIVMEKELVKKIQGWKNEGKTEKEIDFESKNWKLLDGLRIVKPNSFDFIVQTIGVYTNVELIDKACEIIIGRFRDLDMLIHKDEVEIKHSSNTMANSFDIVLENEDYTIGKVIEYVIYEKYFENTKSVTFVGFKKYHPHDSESIIRVAFANPIDVSTIKGYLQDCIQDAINVYVKIKKDFVKND
uniref:DNA-directed RNA polymerase RpoA/D/Rpb3-type domain-containing protein n=1 Tax=viral metagenome TaxID=1070528 RepID=A0A6C0DKG1_9ZZZZ